MLNENEDTAADTCSQTKRDTNVLGVRHHCFTELLMGQ